MSSYAELYGLRNVVDLRRQPRHAAQYDLLKELFQKFSCSDPYCISHLSDDDRDRIYSDAAYHAVLKGLKAQVTDITLYRVMSFGKLIKYTAPGLLGHLGAQDRDWRIITSKQRTLGNWMPLKSFVGGQLTGPRRFTWWTSSDLSLDIFETGHFIGLPDDWIPQRAILLKCDRKSFGHANLRVPCILDAFDSPIFCATDDTASPDVGTCIDLRALPLKIGGSEVVTGPIAVDDIQCLALPLSVPPQPGKTADLNELLPHLTEFYRTV